MALKGIFLFLLVGTSWGALSAQTVFVWPGDANDNGIVNHNDLLFLGRHYGLQGPPRDSISINWTAHETPKWLFPIPGRIDPAHADCNGDGTVDLIDVMTIETNYGLDNGFITADSSSISNLAIDPPLAFSFASDSLASGSTDTVWIELGSPALPIDSLLGFAATITYDTSLIDTAYIYFGDSWLGTPNQDLVFLEKYEPGNLAIAATRTDRTNVYQGQGRIGGVVIVMHDNLKTHAPAGSLQFDFPQALCMDSSGNVVPVFPMTGSIPVFEPSEELFAQIYPVPVSGQLTISLINPKEGSINGRLVNGTGAVVRSFEFSGGQYFLETSDYRGGVYLLELSRGNSVIRKRIVILK